MNLKRKKALVLGANFGGNVGDLYILDSLCDFLKSIGFEEIDILPYPRRNDRRIAELNCTKLRVRLLEPRQALRIAVERLMLHSQLIERLVSSIYFYTDSKLLKKHSKNGAIGPYDAAIFIGGELHIPYSLLDTHSYLTQINCTHLVYGPISVPPDQTKVAFLKKRFNEVPEVSVRDPACLTWLNNCGIKNTCLVPDTAFLSYRPKYRLKQNKRVGICLHSRWAYDKSLDQFISDIIAYGNKHEYVSVFFATNLHEDYAAIDKYKNIYRECPYVSFELPESGRELASLVNTFDITISDRLHAVLVSLIEGTAILPLATRSKILGYCTYLGIDKPLTGKENESGINEAFELALSTVVATRQQNFVQRAHQTVKAYFLEHLV